MILFYLCNLCLSDLVVLTDLMTSLSSMSGGFVLLPGNNHCLYRSSRNWRQECTSKLAADNDGSRMMIVSEGLVAMVARGVSGEFGLSMESVVSESDTLGSRAPTTDQMDSMDT